MANSSGNMTAGVCDELGARALPTARQQRRLVPISGGREPAGERLRGALRRALDAAVDLAGTGAGGGITRMEIGSALGVSALAVCSWTKPSRTEAPSGERLLAMLTDPEVLGEVGQRHLLRRVGAMAQATVVFDDDAHLDEHPVTVQVLQVQGALGDLAKRAERSTRPGSTAGTKLSTGERAGLLADLERVLVEAGELKRSLQVDGVKG